MDVWIYVLMAGLTLLALSAVVRSGQQARTGARLDAVDRKLQAVLDHLGVVAPEPALETVLDHLRRGRKIDAIKAYREATGAGLKEAKDAVEELANKHHL